MESLDLSLFRLINLEWSNIVFDWLCPIARNKTTWVPFYIAGAIALIYYYKKWGIAVIIGSVLLIAATDQSSNFLKKTYQKPRPCAADEKVILRVKKCSQTYAMPSAHAANHTALAVFLSLILPLRKRWKITLLCWAVFIGFSQIYVGLHFPSDVAVGILLGTLWAFLFYWILNRQKNKIWQQNL